MADSNTARSKRWLEKQGWKCWSVEQIMRVPARFPGDKPKVWKVDAFNFGDGLAMKPGAGIMLYQSTTTPNQAARVTKIQGIPEAEIWLRSGGRIQVHGWKQKGGKGGRWLLTVQEIGLDEEFPGTLKSEEKSAVEAPLFEE